MSSSQTKPVFSFCYVKFTQIDTYNSQNSPVALTARDSSNIIVPYMPLFFFCFFVELICDGPTLSSQASNDRPFVESTSSFLCRWLTSRVASPARRRRLCVESGRNHELLRNFPKLRNPCGLMAAGPPLPLVAASGREQGRRARGEQRAEGGNRRGDH